MYPPSSSEEKTPQSPNAPETVTFPVSVPYRTLHENSDLSRSQNTSESSFQTSFALKYGKPIIARSSSLESDVEEKDHNDLPRRTWRKSIHHAIVDWWLCEILLWLVSSVC